MGEEGIQRLGNYIWDDAGHKWIKQSNQPLIGYHISDEEVGTTSYYGYVAADGKYYIMRAIRSGNAVAYTYSSADSGYAAAWADISGQTYRNFADEF